MFEIREISINKGFDLMIGIQECGNEDAEIYYVVVTPIDAQAIFDITKIKFQCE